VAAVAVAVAVAVAAAVAAPAAMAISRDGNKRRELIIYALDQNLQDAKYKGLWMFCWQHRYRLFALHSGLSAIHRISGAFWRRRS
jgi:hypothetical protein